MAAKKLIQEEPNRRGAGKGHSREGAAGANVQNQPHGVPQTVSPEDIEHLMAERTAQLSEEIERLRQAEAALRESEDRFRAIFEQAAVGVAQIETKTGRFLRINKTYCHIVGYKLEEMTATTFMEITHPDDIQGDLDNMQKLVAGEIREFSMEKRYFQKDGSIVWVNLTVSPMWSVGEEPDCHIAVVEDITERKRAEEALRGSEERFRRFAVASSYGFAMGELSGSLVFANAATLRIVEEESEEAFTSKTFYHYYKPRDAERLRQEILPIVLEKGQWVGELPLLSARGKAIATEQNIFLIRDEKGMPRMVGNIITDITDRKQVEAEREGLVAKLEDQNAELERFTYTVSHDLKSPLITINGYVGMLREDLANGDSGAVESDLARISNSADKMDQLLRDVLELSRIGRLVNPSEDVSLEEIAREALGAVHGQINQRGVQVDISPDLPVVFGDRTRLAEALQNLIDNAVKYMGDQTRPRVEVGSRRDGNETIYYVRDNGIGIEPRYHEKIFGLFDQLDQKAEGSGIGLALAKRIVEVHGGRIWVESEGSGHGSTFCFTIAARSESHEFDPCRTGAHEQRSKTRGT